MGALETYVKRDSIWNNQLLQMMVRAAEIVRPRARRTPATTPADLLSTLRLELLLKAEGKMRNLKHISALRLDSVLWRTYAIIMTEADDAAETFQYHCVRAFSL